MSAALDLGTGTGYRIDLAHYRNKGRTFLPLVHQQLMHQSPTAHTVLLGGWGSGKTVAMMMELWRRTWLFPGCVILILGDSEANLLRMLNDFARDYLPTLPGMAGRGFWEQVGRSSKRCPLVKSASRKARRVFWANGSEWLFGLGSSPKNIEGRTVDWAGGDEVRFWAFSEQPEEDTWTVVKSRLRSAAQPHWDGRLHPSGKVPKPGILASTIPAYGPMWELFEDSEPCFPRYDRGPFKGCRVCLRGWLRGAPRSAIIHCQTFDNPGIDADNYLELAAKLDEESQRQVLWGEWGRPSGAIYPHFAETIVRWQIIRDRSVLNYWIVDFGRQTAHAILVQRIPPGHPARQLLTGQHGKGPRPDQDAWVVVDEEAIDANRGPEHHARTVLGKHKGMEIEEICGDQAGVQIQRYDDSSQLRAWERMIRRHGRHVRRKQVKIEKRKEITRIDNGIDAVRTMQRDGEGYCHLYATTDLEARGRRWGKTPDNRKRLGYVDSMRRYHRINGRIPKQVDHPADCGRYLVINYEWRRVGAIRSLGNLGR